MQKGFAPTNLEYLNWFILILTVWLIPKFVFSVCSFLGWAHCAYHKTDTNYGTGIGVLLFIMLVPLAVFSNTLGISSVHVRYVTFMSPDLPWSFDGYRIVQFSDAHVGTYTGWRSYILDKAMDKIMDQNADMIVFTGDLQNMQPSEVEAKLPVLSRLKARDGVFSVLGNHDYAYYLNADKATSERNEREMVRLQKAMGWTLLRNENRIVRRGKDSIVVAGMEYEGNSVKVPNRGDLKKTLCGIRQDSTFVLMLQHDPTAWKTDILPHSKAQLTLSGHTHGGQIVINGWSPASYFYDEWEGMYKKGNRAMNVSTGLGALIPFRFLCSPEIVVIDLVRETWYDKLDWELKNEIKKVAYYVDEIEELDSLGYLDSIRKLNRERTLYRVLYGYEYYMDFKELLDKPREKTKFYSDDF